MMNKKQLSQGQNLILLVMATGTGKTYTSIATNILFFEKDGPTKTVWFFEHPYPKGYKSYSRSKPLTIAEFNLDKAWWGRAAYPDRKTTEHAWKIPAKALTARNYNLDCKNPYEEEVNHRDPLELMVEYQEIVKKRNKAQAVLKTELMICLKGNP